MSRKFKLQNKYYGEKFRMFSRVNIEIKEGLTILVGCNGTGKTTFLKQVERQLEDNEIIFLYHNNISDGIRTQREKALMFGGNINFLAASLTTMSSEGENIKLVIREVVRKMGMLIRNNPNANEYWFLFDAIDSGLSIDNIVELKENLFSFIIKENKGKEVYILVSTNSYEFARGESCLDVSTGRYISFKDYEEYRNFVIKSREKKDKRYDK